MRDWHKIENTSRKPLGEGVIHPDECVKMLIQGVEWSVRPLYPPEGIMFTPVIGDDVSFCVDAGDANIEVQSIAEAIAEDLPEYLDGSNLVLDAGDSTGYLARICKYIITLLDQQYDLDDETKTSLLSFRGVTAPKWLEQGIRHAQSMPPQPPEEKDGEETDSQTDA